MPKWIHDRADRLMEKNPEMPESMAFGIATQQARKLGKTAGVAREVREAIVEEAVPAIAALAGGAGAAYYDKNPSAGAALGAGIGAVPSLTGVTGKLLRKLGEDDAARRIRIKGALLGEGLPSLGGIIGAGLGARRGRPVAGSAFGASIGALPGLLLSPEDEKSAAAIEPIKAMGAFTPPKASNTPFLPKGVAGTKMDPRNKFKASSEVGFEEAFDQKTDGLKFEPPSIKMSAAGHLGSKIAFQTSAFSGPLTEGGFIARSSLGMPSNPGGIKVSGPPSQLGSREDPDTDAHVARGADEKRASLAGAALFALGAISCWEAKQAAVSSPKAQLSSSQANKAAPKMTNPSGPSIAQISKPKGFGTPLAGATKSAEVKEAVLKEMVRLGLKDVPGTPRLLMKHRTPAARAAVAQTVGGAYDRVVTNPLMSGANKVLQGLPEGKLRGAATNVARSVASDPIGMGVSALLPVPGTELAYMGAKKGVGKLINAMDPAGAAAAKALG